MEESKSPLCKGWNQGFFFSPLSSPVFHNMSGFEAAPHSQVHGLWCLVSRVPAHGQPGAVVPSLPALYITLGTLHKHLFARSEAVIICLYSRDAFFHSSVNLLRLNMEKKGVTGSFQDFIAFFNVWPPLALLSRYCYQCSLPNFAVG